MSESFHSNKFNKTVWLTNHAIEAMSKRHITLSEVKQLIEEGEYRAQHIPHAWIFLFFPARKDNLVCAAVTDEESIIIKTLMINWKERAAQ